MTGELRVRDVTLRDGLQLTGKLLSVDRKVEIIRALLAEGATELEIGSMARPDLVPPLANTTDVIAQLTPHELERCWVWVATPGHVARAAAAGARRFQYCLSASESHNKANLGRDVEASLAALPEAIEIAKGVGGTVQLAIATSFTCPFEGRVPVERIVSIAADPRVKDVTDVVICDTLGHAIPAEVSAIFAALRNAGVTHSLGFHGHDTWGMGVANSLAAVAAGAAFVDGTLGGLGGCPFAPGASGNVSLEDLLFAGRPSWLTPDSFSRIGVLSASLIAELEEPSRSRSVEAAKSTSAQFEWSLAAQAG